MTTAFRQGPIISHIEDSVLESHSPRASVSVRGKRPFNSIDTTEE